MHHRRTDFGRRATLRGVDRAPFAMLAAGLLALGWLSTPARAADEKEKAARDASATASARLDRELREQVRPLLDRYCGKCHSSEEPEADVNLQRFTSMAEARRGVSTWRKVVDVLDKGEMPPPEARQPKPEDRRALRGWVGRYLDFEAHAERRRPGPGDHAAAQQRRVHPDDPRPHRRPARPAREFPQDGAAGEGFTNTGDALVMSPALLGKYLDAAKDVAAHAVPLPDGFRFSPAAGRRDWTDELIAGIRRLYDRFADKDGKIPLEAYLAATIELRSRSVDQAIEPAEIRDLADPPRPERRSTSGSLWETLGGARFAASRPAGRWATSARDGGPPGRAMSRPWPPRSGGGRGALAVQQRRLLLRRRLAGARHRDGRGPEPAAEAAGFHPQRRGRALPVGRGCRRRARGRRRRLATAAAGAAGPAGPVAPRRPRPGPIPGRPPPLDARRDPQVPRRRGRGARRLPTGPGSRRWPDRTASRPTPWPRGSTTSGWPARRPRGSRAT